MRAAVPTLLKMMLAALAVQLSMTGLAAAQTKITIGVPPVPEFVLPMIAVEKGYFKDHGIDATIKIIPGGQSMPAALQSDSLQIAALSTASLIQVTDSGLDLVVVSGGAIASVDDTNYGIVAGANSEIEKPEDFIGKRIGTPGLGSFFHIMAREWFRRKGVDWKKITFVESTFPQLGDLLKARTVDAVLSTNPFLQRAAIPGIGGKVFYIAADLPDRLPPFVYAGSRSWADAHREAATGFKRAMDEAIAFQQHDLPAALEIFGKYVKMPPEVLKTLTINKLDTNVTPQQVQLWVDMMDKQDMLRNFKSPDALFLK
ncbi:ABC transporter substrate-binding protein [Bradyrhizobium sp. SRS-191]|uniref:ABC transporter substrate-binding protein n=1 Tax=Bradyrhizobium sp. SRS-191 TaxID=2962606 RepID=UPI00211EC573|nr:ABC transporter substrate-binding protein [Bradyrhizobium sp. SRS-191]